MGVNRLEGLGLPLMKRLSASMPETERVKCLVLGVPKAVLVKEEDYVGSIDEIVVLNRIGKTLTSTLDAKTVLQQIMSHISNIFKPDRWSLMLADEAQNDLYFEIYVGKESSKVKAARVKLGQGIAGWVAQNGKPLLIKDVNQAPEFCGPLEKLLNLTHHMAVCIPLKVRDKVLGVIELLYNPGALVISDHGMMILTTIADYAAIALENARIYAKIQEISVIDDVTGLHNSRSMHNLLETELNRCKRYGMPLSIIFLDLDYFKNVNDTYGHLAGSKLLREIGAVMKASVRKVDSLSRYGGDEFILILPNASKASAFKIAQRLQRAINRQVFLRDDGLEVKITSSFGVASFPDDAPTKDELIRRSDEAMYRVKNSTRDGIALA